MGLVRGRDGCTGVSQLYWPTQYFPPCLRHDFDWIMGNDGVAGSQIFYELQRAYGMTRFRSGLRTGAVTVAWYAWAKVGATQYAAAMAAETLSAAPLPFRPLSGVFLFSAGVSLFVSFFPSDFSLIQGVSAGGAIGA